MGLIDKLIADPKTSATVIVGAVVQIIAVFGFNASAETQATIIGLFVLVLGIVARDTKELPPPRS